MNPDEQDQCILRAFKARKVAQGELSRHKIVVQEMAEHLGKLAHHLQRSILGTVTKEAADGRLTFRDEGMIVGTPVVYPAEQDIIETVNEIDRLTKEISRLNAILN